MPDKYVFLGYHETDMTVSLSFQGVPFTFKAETAEQFEHAKQLGARISLAANCLADATDAELKRGRFRKF